MSLNCDAEQKMIVTCVTCNTTTPITATDDLPDDPEGNRQIASLTTAGSQLMDTIECLNDPQETWTVFQLFRSSDRSSGNSDHELPYDGLNTSTMSDATLPLDPEDYTDTVSNSKSAKTKCALKRQLRSKREQLRQPPIALSTSVTDVCVPADSATEHTISTTSPRKNCSSPTSNCLAVTWLIGDMLWGHVSGHPWWPCIVSYDPVTARFTRQRTGVQVHVQFFGAEREHGWVGLRSLMTYCGREAFELEAAKHRDWIIREGRRRSAWNIAVAQAEQAFKLDKHERILQFTYSYDVCRTTTGPRSKQTKKRKMLPDSEILQPVVNKRRKKENNELSVDAVIDAVVAAAAASVDVGSEADIDWLPSSTGDALKHEMYGRMNRVKLRAHRKWVKKSRTTLNQLAHNERNEMNIETASIALCCHGKIPESDTSLLVDGLTQLSECSSECAALVLKTSSPVLNEKNTWHRTHKCSECEKLRGQLAANDVGDGGNPKLPLPPPVGDGKAEGKENRRERRQSTVISDCEHEQPFEKPHVIRRKSTSNVGRGRGRKSDVISCVERDLLTNTGELDAPQTTENIPDLGCVMEKKRKSTRICASRGKHDETLFHSIKTEILTEPCALNDVDQSLDTNNNNQEELSVQRRGQRFKPPTDTQLEILKLNSSYAVRGLSMTHAICAMCEQLIDESTAAAGSLVCCSGDCIRCFHSRCIGLGTTVATDGENGFTCDECTTGLHTCYVCRKATTDTLKCSALPACGRFYHRDCALRFKTARFIKDRLICPLHSCTTCLADAQDETDTKYQQASKGRMYQCIKCPTAYHVNDLCIPAGSVPVSGLSIICSRHFAADTHSRYHTRVNVSWCFVCSKGGTLVCCDNCPAAYHAECLETSPPDGAWFCKDCTAGRTLHYGDIVWVKLGKFRWWPCEICHPRHVPDNIAAMTHVVGEFPVRFFGTNEYYWTFQGRVFHFQAEDTGATGRKSSTSSTLVKSFMKGLAEAKEAYNVWLDVHSKRDETLAEKHNRKPVPYKHVKSNVVIGNIEMPRVNIDELPRCQCKPDSEMPCGPDSDCINRCMFYECHPAVCPAGNRCMNQRFELRQHPAVKPVRTDKRGWGLRTLVDIQKGQFVSEYVGDLIDESECRRRLESARTQNIENFYMLTLDKNRVIDAGPKGNFSRFMNHSCQPNCESQKWTVNGDIHVGLFAITDIAAGTELTFNYQLDCYGNEKTICRCGTAACSGFIGVRPKTMNEKTKKCCRQSTKRLKTTVCFICGLDAATGQCDQCDVVRCTSSFCGKNYHLKCLELTTLPQGRWKCPRHVCSQCSLRAVTMCSVCVTSFCRNHTSGNIVELIPITKASDLPIASGSLMCLTHATRLAEQSEPTGSAQLQNIPVSSSVETKVLKRKRRPALNCKKKHRQPATIQGKGRRVTGLKVRRCRQQNVVVKCEIDSEVKVKRSREKKQIVGNIVCQLNIDNVENVVNVENNINKLKIESVSEENELVKCELVKCELV